MRKKIEAENPSCSWRWRILPEVRKEASGAEEHGRRSRNGEGDRRKAAVLSECRPEQCTSVPSATSGTSRPHVLLGTNCHLPVLMLPVLDFM